MTRQIIYPEPIEQAISAIESWLESLGKSNVLGQYSLSRRSLALLLLQKDPTLWQTLEQAPQQQQEIEILLTVAQNQLQYPLDLAIAETRQKQARDLEALTIQTTKPAANSYWSSPNSSQVRNSRNYCKTQTYGYGNYSW